MFNQHKISDLPLPHFATIQMALSSKMYGDIPDNRQKVGNKIVVFNRATVKCYLLIYNMYA